MVRFLVFEAIEGFLFGDQTGKEKLQGVEHPVIGDAALNDIIECLLFAGPVIRYETKPFAVINREVFDPDIQLRQQFVVVSVAVDDSRQVAKPPALRPAGCCRCRGCRRAG